MAPNRRSGPSSSDDNENPDVATVIAQQLQAIITQVANNANNANNGNNGEKWKIWETIMFYKTFQLATPRVHGKGGANNDFTSVNKNMENVIDTWFHELAKLVPHLVTPETSRIKRYIAGLAPEIRGMIRATQPDTIQTAILRAGILTDGMQSVVYVNQGH
ncbi:hypothetical protein Tco_1078450 [Tanacetum coccineum]|uniref:Reverse transcriptase domain-containing protein n=1 Tax=Tanacetum coccineum TaxID=301880 RepID=A0ABQ5HP45_9ASTR